MKKILFISFTNGFGGPQMWLDDVVNNTIFRENFNVYIFYINSKYFGVAGKFKFYLDLWKKLTEYRPCIVYVNHDIDWAAYSVVGVRLYGSCKVVVHSRNSQFRDGVQYSMHINIFMMLRRWIVRLGTTLPLAISDSSAVAMFGTRDGVFIMPSFINFERLHRKIDPSEEIVKIRENGRFKIGCVGRYDRQKNQKLLIDAYAKSDMLKQWAQIILVGCGKMASELENLKRKYHLDDRHVLFVPPRESIGLWYRFVFDVLAVPSLYEGQGRIVAEGQSFGLEVILSPSVSDDACLVNSNIIRVPTFSVMQWTMALEQAIINTRKRLPCFSYMTVKDSPLNMQFQIGRLVKLLAQL